MSAPKILIVRGGAIGDFILTLPVFAALRSQFSHCRLETLAYPRVAPLAKAGGLVDDFRGIEGPELACFFAKGGELNSEMSDYFAGFEVVVSFLFDPDFIFQTNVVSVMFGQFIAGRHRPDETGSPTTHASQAFLSALERLAIFDFDPVPRLKVGPANGLSLPKGRWLAVHPGSGSPSKNWPTAGWESLLKQLVGETDLSVLLLGGDAEEDRLERLADVLPKGRARVFQSRPLLDVAKVMTDCIGFIGHDSGLSHLASALGVPALVLWGETNERIWRPPGETVSILKHGDGLGALPPEIVRQAISFL
jgi:heptosyltransferase-3